MGLLWWRALEVHLLCSSVDECLLPLLKGNTGGAAVLGRFTRLRRWAKSRGARPSSFSRDGASDLRSAGWSKGTGVLGDPPLLTAPPGRVEDERGAVGGEGSCGRRLSAGAGASLRSLATFPVSARRRGRARIPHPVVGPLGCPQSYTSAYSGGRAWWRCRWGGVVVLYVLYAVLSFALAFLAALMVCLCPGGREGEPAQKPLEEGPPADGP